MSVTKPPGIAQGIRGLVHDAVELTLHLVEDGHESVARAAMRVLGRIEPIAETARTIDELRKAVTTGVLGGARTLNRALERATDPALELALTAIAIGESGQDRAPVAMRSDMLDKKHWAADAAIGALNAIVGDHLHDTGNGLALAMSLRHRDRYLAPTSSEIEDPRPVVCIFVHGLATTEWSWCMNATEYHGDATASFGTLLARDLDITPIYARYNTGRHISENGRALADRIESFVRAYPIPLREVILVGHSMGGLVVRSACHYGATAEHAWLGLVRRVFSLGSPHDGTPLEKIGNVVTAILGAIDLPGTRIPARLLQGRSAGIKDLRYGNLVDEDWGGRDPDALLEDSRTEVPLTDGIAYHYISATVTRDPEHPLGRVIGDLLVRVPSASGASGVHGSRFVISSQCHGGVLHHQLQNHPDVYRELLAALSDDATIVGR